MTRFADLFALALFASVASAAEVQPDTTVPIKVGAVQPFSGGVELCSRQAKLGLDLAIKEIKAAGRILGRPVEIVNEDNKTNPDGAANATRKLRMH